MLQKCSQNPSTHQKRQNDVLRSNINIDAFPKNYEETVLKRDQFRPIKNFSLT